jgi:hypothetical protein
MPKVGLAGVAVPFLEIPISWLSRGSRDPFKRENRPHNRGRNTGMGKVECERVEKGCLDGLR